jgi:formimidoylglutamate deiminase
MTRYFARHALLDDGWAHDVHIDVDGERTIVAISPASAPQGATPLEGIVLPGMINAHSHAFQRALAGGTETASANGDSFWTWREAMYAALDTLGPDAFEALTTDAFRSMRRAGYTRVCEFHYVHNAPDGSQYADPNELAHRVVAAARSAGIGLTLLPVLYRFSGFGEAPPHAHQRRFVRSLDAYATAWQALRDAYRDEPGVVIGIAPHSLRAVAPSDLRQLVELARDRAGGGAVPFHIHVSEQRREVDACVAEHGVTPIALLAKNVALDERWCLVHATHATPDERDAIVRAGAVVALCPTTEANLGDGIFPAADFVRAGGRIAIGSDSNASIDVAEELRWLEYVQRLALQQRNVLHDEATPQVARFVYQRCATGGAQASGVRTGHLAPGHRFEAILLGDDARFDGLSAGFRQAQGDSADAALAGAIFRSGGWNLRETPGFR